MQRTEGTMLVSIQRVIFPQTKIHKAKIQSTVQVSWAVSGLEDGMEHAALSHALMH